MKVGQISFTGSNPMELTEVINEQSGKTKNLPEDALQIGATIKAYLNATQQLLAEKYVHLQDIVPNHLLNPGNVLIANCSDGVVIRYEPKNESLRTFVAVTDDSFSNLAYQCSQQLICCQKNKNLLHDFTPKGIELGLFISDSPTNITNPFATININFDVFYEPPLQQASPPQKPFCLLSVLNSFEFNIEGEMLNTDGKANGQKFVTRTKMKLPVGWDCIEVYPDTNINCWKPEYALVWAESDILASALTFHMQESSYQQLDPKAEARRQYSKLLDEFRALLDSNPEREQTLQTFLQTHPTLLCPAHTKMWPKLDLGAKETDFVFCDANNEYLLIELEKSTHKLFNKDGHLSAAVSHAQGQVTDWKRYLEDNLATVQRELKLTSISANPSALIIIGRSKTLTEENRRKLTSIHNEHPKTRILTYDEVYNNAKTVIENLLGPIWEAGGNTQIYYPRG